MSQVAQADSLVQKYNLTWHASGGLMWLGSGQLIDDRREDWVACGSLNFSWLATQNFSQAAV